MPEQFNLPSELPLIDEERIRWQTYWNISRETIPPFAAMEAYAVQFPHAGPHKDEIVFIAQKPGVLQERPDHLGFHRTVPLAPEHVMFNGPEATPHESFGRGTFDLPAQALIHRSTYGGILSSIGQFSEEQFVQTHLMPRDNSWLLWQTAADGFVALGVNNPFEATTPLSNANLPGELITAIVGRGTHVRHSGGTFMNGGPAIVQTGQIVRSAAVGDCVPFNTGITEAVAGAGYSSGVHPINQGLLCQREGLYLVGFCGTISAVDMVPAVPNNSALVLQFAVGTINAADTLGTPTLYQGVRRHYTDSDSYGSIQHDKGAENVAFQGRLNLSENQVVQVYNAGAYPITVLHAYLWGISLGRRLPTS